MEILSPVKALNLVPFRLQLHENENEIKNIRQIIAESILTKIS